MQKLIRFILKYNFIIIFIIIELFSLSLLINNNPFQRLIFLNKFQNISGYFYEKYNNASSYFNLKSENQKLVEENLLLQNELLRNKYNIIDDSAKIRSELINKYLVIPARVINNSVNRQYNYLTLEAGSNNGIEKDMAVVNNRGVVGVVIGVTKNYSSVISILNPKISISSKIRKNGYFGLLNWDGNNYRKSVLNGIPDFVEIMPGDTIVSSGYSAIFPENQLIGFITEFKKKEGSGFWEIDVKLFADFKKLYNVFVVKNINKTEIKLLEKSFKDDRDNY